MSHSDAYYLRLSLELSVAIVNRVCLHYTSSAMEPVFTHELSKKEWDFTHRFRYKTTLYGVDLEFEVSYKEWASVRRETTGWWDGFWNGAYHTVEVERTMWVRDDHFLFHQLKPVYTYDCVDSDPEIHYE